MLQNDLESIILNNFKAFLTKSFTISTKFSSKESAN
jgi:hypothetical protein